MHTGASTMKLLGTIIVLLTLFLPTGNVSAVEATAPLEINGFRLGASIDEYDFITNQNYMQEVMIDNIGGFRRGIISYGTCEKPGEIIRIKLKYKEDSYKFFQQLLDRYEEKFGEPDDFTGDTFGVVIAWKWKFKDKNGDDVSLTLQHNKKNLDETIGNMVKLSMPSRVESERLCFIKSCKMANTKCPANMMREDWENLIPK